MKSSYLEIIEKWKSKNISSIEDLQTVLSNFSILFAYNSGAIENSEITYHNTREIFENGKVINFTGSLRTLYEIENQKKCYDYLLEKIIAKEPITPTLIKEIHYKLTQGTYDQTRWEKGERPGEYKINDYCVADGQGALPEEVPTEIEELCEEMISIPDRGDNILKAAAYLHCKFENIHPFADGNGRVGRTLMNYMLTTSNYPPLIVKNETKDKYYDALSQYDKTGEVEQFVTYMKNALEDTWCLNDTPKKKLNKIIDYDIER